MYRSKVDGKTVGYLAHPRTASHSVREHLRRYCETELIVNHHWPIKTVCDPTRTVTGHDYNLLQFDRVITNVRNPFDAICSWAAMLGKSVQGNVLFVINRNIDKAYYKYHEDGTATMWPMADLADSIIQFEHLQDDWDVECDLLGLPRAKLEHLTRRQRLGKDPHYWREIISGEEREVIERVFAPELSRYGYSF